MFLRLKGVLISVFVIFNLWYIGSGIYRYFSYQTPPIITTTGLEQNGTYNKNLRCSITSCNTYKISKINLLLDNKHIDLGSAENIGAKKFEVPLCIDTTNMTNTNHTLTLEATDASYHHNKTTATYNFFVDNRPLRASFFEPEYKVFQGKTLHVKIQSNKQCAKAIIQFLANTYVLTPTTKQSTEYECFIPIDCEETPTQSQLTAELEDLVKNNLTLTSQVIIAPFEFKKQHGFLVEQTKIDEEREISASHKVLEEALGKWVKESSKEKLWHGPFETPIEALRMSTPFGEIRVTPERGRHMHKGVDLINRPHCPVWASQTGKVIIKDRFTLTGNTVVLDHGLGVFTLYAHLEEYADLQVGDLVKKGSPVGKLGMTGYATGYHLHWEIRVNNIPVDPLEWTTTVY